MPRYLLEDVGRGSTDPFMISDYTHGESKDWKFSGFVACSRLCLASEPRPLSPAGGWYTGPTYRPQNVLLTNSLEIIEKILGMCTDACRPQARVACTFLIIVHHISYLFMFVLLLQNGHRRIGFPNGSEVAHRTIEGTEFA